jgi:hypothetical protein
MPTVWRTEGADSLLDKDGNTELGARAVEEIKAQLDHANPEVRLNACRAVLELLYGPPPIATDDEDDEDESV